MSGVMVGSVNTKRMEAAASPAPLLILPIVLISLLKFTEFSVSLHRARVGTSTWYFRFSPRAILRVREDGTWSWSIAPEQWRRRIEPIIARAEAMLAAYEDALPETGEAESSRLTL